MCCVPYAYLYRIYAYGMYRTRIRIWYDRTRMVWLFVPYEYIAVSICDQICQKGSYTRTASGLTFHYHSTDTTIDQQFMLVPLPNLLRSAFTEASFTGLSGIHGCSGGLLMASACPARQTDGRESPQDWLMRLGINVATF